MLRSRLMSASSAPLTLDDWERLDEDDSRELVDGVLEDAEMPDATHETIVMWLCMTLGPYFLARDGWVGASGLKLAVSPRRGRLGDVVCYAARRPPARGLVRTPPDIIVEVISPRREDQRRDRLDKASDYATFGVRFYWLMDPEARTIEILELGADGRYVRALTAAEGAHAVPGFEGLTIDLDALWASVDRLA